MTRHARDLVGTEAARFRRSALALGATVAITACAARVPPPPTDGPAALASSAPSSAAVEQARPLTELAREAEARGWTALGTDNVRALFVKPGNVAISPLGIGLAALAADALLAGDAPKQRPYTALTHTAAACFGAFHQGLRFSVAKGIDVSADGLDVAYLLVPGQHGGKSLEPGPVSRCAPAYQPLEQRPVAPAAKDVLVGFDKAGGARASSEPSLSLDGDKLGAVQSSGMFVAMSCRSATPTFWSCAKAPPGDRTNPSTSGDVGLLARSMQLPAPPLGLVSWPTASVQPAPHQVVVAVSIDALGLSKREARAQSFVAVMPTSCEQGALRTVDAATIETMRAAARLPRSVPIELRMPRVGASTTTKAAAPAPLSDLAVSAHVTTYPCTGSPAGPADGRAVVALDRSFLYALIDDETEAILFAGRVDDPTPDDSKVVDHATGAGAGSSGGIMRIPTPR